MTIEQLNRLQWEDLPRLCKYAKGEDAELWLDQLAAYLKHTGLSREYWSTITIRLLDEDLRVLVQDKLETTEKGDWSWEAFSRCLRQEVNGHCRSTAFQELCNNYPAFTIVAGASLVSVGCALTLPVMVGIAGLGAIGSTGVVLSTMQSLAGIAAVTSGTAIVKTTVDKLEDK